MSSSSVRNRRNRHSTRNRSRSQSHSPLASVLHSKSLPNFEQLFDDIKKAYPTMTNDEQIQEMMKDHLKKRQEVLYKLIEQYSSDSTYFESIKFLTTSKSFRLPILSFTLFIFIIACIFGIFIGDVYFYDTYAFSPSKSAIQSVNHDIVNNRNNGNDKINIVDVRNDQFSESVSPGSRHIHSWGKGEEEWFNNAVKSIELPEHDEDNANRLMNEAISKQFTHSLTKFITYDKFDVSKLTDDQKFLLLCWAACAGDVEAVTTILDHLDDQNKLSIFTVNAKLNPLSPFGYAIVYGRKNVIDQFSGSENKPESTDLDTSITKAIEQNNIENDDDRATILDGLYNKFYDQIVSIDKHFQLAVKNKRIKSAVVLAKHGASLDGRFLVFILENEEDDEAAKTLNELLSKIEIAIKTVKDDEDVWDQRPLTIALQQRKWNSAEVLLNHGASFDTKSVLIVIEKENDKTAAETLHKLLSKTRKDGITMKESLTFAIKQKNKPQTVQELLQHITKGELAVGKAGWNETPLVVAFKNEQWEIVKALLEKDATINNKGKNELDPIHHQFDDDDDDDFDRIKEALAAEIKILMR